MTQHIDGTGSMNARCGQTDRCDPGDSGDPADPAGPANLGKAADDRPTRWLGAAGWAALTFASGCSGTGSDGRSLSFLDPQGPIAAAQRHHLFEVLVLLSIVVLPVLVLTPLFVWRYRLGNSKSKYTPKWSFSWPLEIAIWGVPIAVIAVMAVLMVRSSHKLDPYRPLASDQAPLQVQVIGYDWKWLFIYPKLGIATIGEMAFPAGRPLTLELTSATVMQSFQVPSLGSQMYAMGGMVSQLHLLADRPGRFLGENMLYNGSGFHQQKFTAEAMSAADFAAWVQRVRHQGVALDAHAMQVLAGRNDMTKLRSSITGAQAMPSGTLYLTGSFDRLFNQVVEATRAP